MERFAGKVALVTGAARGQGRSHALEFASEGADIVAIDICSQMDSVGYPMSTPEDLDETSALIEKFGRKVSAHRVDVRDREKLGAAVTAGIKDLGRLDFVAANAGIMPSVGEMADTMEAWQESIDVILTGTLNTLDAVYPPMVAQGEGGSIVITGSMAAVQPVMRTENGRGLGILGYSAAKAALVNLMQNYASFLAEHNIRVNVVHPTGVGTPMVVNEEFTRSQAGKTRADLGVLMNAIDVRMLDAEDISHLVTFLCQDESKYITGSSIRLDAGASLR